MKSDSSDQHEEPCHDSLPLLKQLIEQTKLLAQNRHSAELDPCLLEKIGRIACMTANEVHQNTLQLKAIRQSLEALVEMYRTVNPSAALELDRLGKLRAEIERCCPPEGKPELICRYDPCVRDGGAQRGDGYSAKSKASICPVQISEKPHPMWKIVEKPHHIEDDKLPIVPRGPFVGQIVPSTPTPNVLDFRSGGVPTPGGQEPVTFRTFTSTELSAGWPPDMSGAKGGDVVLMSGNLWLKLSVDGGKSFTDLDFTKLFAADTTYGGWAGDQVIHYVPSIDCFVLYVQSFKGTGANTNKNVIKIALANPADLKKFSGGRDAWRRQWDFTSDTFGLGASWMDFPDMSYGEKFLHVNTNVFAAQTGKLFFELPLADLQAGRGFSFLYAFINDPISIGSPTQNIVGDENFWAGHVNNSTMRIYQSKGGDPNYSWRERNINNWPMTTDNNIVSAAPDWADWLSEDHRIIGATRVNNQLWFAWTASTGDGGGGGFKFPHPHVQIAKFDLGQDYKLIEQMQVWNPDHAFSYPCLITNTDNEVGISLAWGGGKFFGSHAVGILGDFVVWYGVASTETSLRQQQDDALNKLTNPDGSPMMFSRWGDYVHVRLAQPDTRYFSAFGYAVLDDPSATPAEKMQYLYVEFGRNKQTPPPIK